MIWPLFRCLGRNLSNFWWFFGKFKKSKRHSEIIWPLLKAWNSISVFSLMHEQHNGGAMMKLPRYFVLPKLTIKGGGFLILHHWLYPWMLQDGSGIYRSRGRPGWKQKRIFQKTCWFYDFYVIFMCWHRMVLLFFARVVISMQNKLDIKFAGRSIFWFKCWPLIRNPFC